MGLWWDHGRGNGCGQWALSWVFLSQTGASCVWPKPMSSPEPFPRDLGAQPLQGVSAGGWLGWGSPCCVQGWRLRGLKVQSPALPRVSDRDSWLWGAQPAPQGHIPVLSPVQNPPCCPVVSTCAPPHTPGCPQRVPTLSGGAQKGSGCRRGLHRSAGVQRGACACVCPPGQPGECVCVCARVCVRHCARPRGRQLGAPTARPARRRGTGTGPGSRGGGGGRQLGAGQADRGGSGETGAEPGAGNGGSGRGAAGCGNRGDIAFRGTGGGAWRWKRVREGQPGKVTETRVPGGGQPGSGRRVARREPGSGRGRAGAGPGSKRQVSAPEGEQPSAATRLRETARFGNPTPGRGDNPLRGPRTGGSPIRVGGIPGGGATQFGDLSGGVGSPVRGSGSGEGGQPGSGTRLRRRGTGRSEG